MLLPLLLNNALATPPTPGGGGTFQHDWSAAVAIETAWRTVVTEAESTVGEERTQLWGKPARTVSLRWVGVERSEAQRLMFALLRAGADQTYVPIYCDQAITTSSSSGTTINCPTADRRFAVGSAVIIHQIGDGGRATNAQVRIISAVGGSSLTLYTALAGSYPAGALVYPAILAEVELERLGSFLTSQVCVVETTFREVIGNAAIPALTNGLTVLGSFPSATCESATLNLFDIDHDWATSLEAGHLRPGEDYERGRGRQVYARGTRPLWRWGVSLLFDTRAEAFDVIELFDSLRGRTGALWWPFPGNIWSAAGYATGYVEILAAGQIEDVQELVSHVAVLFTDGTWAVRRISTVALTGGVWRITPTEALPAGNLSDVSRVTPCILARLESDALEEEWLTDQVCRLRLDVRELVSEAAVASVSDPEAC